MGLGTRLMGGVNSAAAVVAAALVAAAVALASVAVGAEAPFAAVAVALADARIELAWSGVT